MTRTKRNIITSVVAAAIMAVAACLLTLIPTAYADVVKGNGFGNVAAVQTRLATLGYYRSTVDGRWGSATATAVKKFQADNGLKADGIVGGSTERALKVSLPVTGGISYGKTDFNVAAVQARLKTFGYYTSTVSVVGGTGTLQAVLRDQSARGMTVAG